jgi:hypothetical protein
MQRQEAPSSGGGLWPDGMSEVDLLFLEKERNALLQNEVSLLHSQRDYLEEKLQQSQNDISRLWDSLEESLLSLSAEKCANDLLVEQFSGLLREQCNKDEVEPVVQYDVGMTIQTPYGAAVILEIRSDGIMSVEPTNWIDPENKPAKFFISKKDLSRRTWTEEQIKVNQRDFSPPKDVPDGECICF